MSLIHSENFEGVELKIDSVTNKKNSKNDEHKVEKTDIINQPLSSIKCYFLLKNFH